MLINGSAICKGYTETFKAFMDYLDMECIIVYGQANGSGGYGDHAWNIVKIDGKYCHVDSTWDDPVFGKIEKNGISNGGK